MKRAILSAFIAAGLLASVGEARMIYVNGTTGNDNWTGLCEVWDGGTCGPKRTIQAGIAVADPGDTVQVADGTYTGDGNRDLDYGGKLITVRSENGPDTCIIDCQGSSGDPHRGFYFHSGETTDAVLDGVTIRNGRVWDSGGGVSCRNGSSPTISDCVITENSVSGTNNFGGGVYCSDSSPTISDCTIAGNVGRGIACENSSPAIITCLISENDGGVWCRHHCEPTIIDCTLSGNTAAYGGGVYCDNFCQPTIIGCTISGNTVSGRGGGIFCGDRSTLTAHLCHITGNSAEMGAGILFDTGGSYSFDCTITDCTITENTAEYGGGVQAITHDLWVSGCTIRNNVAEIRGGGILCESAAIMNCTIDGNELTGQFGEGAGISILMQSDVMVANCLIIHNSTVDLGGGLYADDSTVTVANCTFSANSAGQGGAVHLRTRSFLSLTNCILWGDDAPLGPEISLTTSDHPSTADVQYSDVQGGEALAYVEDGCILNWGEGSIDADPLFVDPANGDYHLSFGSPCIDAADNTAVPPGVTTDLDGNPRFVDDPSTPDTGVPGGAGGNAIVDMGAYEFQPPVAAEIDIKPGSCPNPLNVRSRGVVPVAIVGTASFDVTQIDLGTIELARADGVGGSVSPLNGPPGPGMVVEDVATPFEGDPCECHELMGDGIDDLSLKFSTEDVVVALELGGMPTRTELRLRVSGLLIDQTPFEGDDCVLLLTPNPGQAGSLLDADVDADTSSDESAEEQEETASAATELDAEEEAEELFTEPMAGCGILSPALVLMTLGGLFLSRLGRGAARRRY